MRNNMHDAALWEEFREFQRGENEKWARVMAILDDHIAQQKQVITILDKLTKDTITNK